MVFIGYTHYFEIHTQEFDLDKWRDLVRDVKHLFANLPEHSDSSGGYHADDPLDIDADSHGPTPIANDIKIIFNGVGEHGCETFYLKRENNEEAFCKTNRYPYDLIVQVVLILATYHLRDQIEVNSDGDVEDWQSAVTLTGKMFGLKAKVSKGEGAFLTVSKPQKAALNLTDHLDPNRGEVI